MKYIADNLLKISFETVLEPTDLKHKKKYANCFSPNSVYVFMYVHTSLLVELTNENSSSMPVQDQETHQARLTTTHIIIDEFPRG